MPIKEVYKLKELDFIKQMAFAYLTCERLYPNYVYFSHNCHFGDSSKLRKAIDYLKNKLFDKNINKQQINLLIANIDNVTPQPADYETITASAALDACGVIHESLLFLIDKRISRIYDISTMAIDTVDMYIQSVENIDYNEDKYFQEKIDKHVLMQREISIQKGIIFYLFKINHIEVSDIITLNQLQQNKNTGSLNL